MSTQTSKSRTYKSCVSIFTLEWLKWIKAEANDWHCFFWWSSKFWKCSRKGRSNYVWGLIKLANMKHFETVRIHFALVGIEPSQFHFPFNKKYLVINLIDSIYLVLVWTFVFYVSDSVEEYMNSFYALIITCSIFVSYSTTIFNMSKLLEFFDDCEAFHDDGKQLNDLLLIFKWSPL